MGGGHAKKNRWDEGTPAAPAAVPPPPGPPPPPPPGVAPAAGAGAMASDALEKARKVAAISKQIQAQIQEQVASHLSSLTPPTGQFEDIRVQISTLPGLFQSGAQSSKLTFKPAPLLLDSQGRQIDETGKVRTHCAQHARASWQPAWNAVWVGP